MIAEKNAIKFEVIKEKSTALVRVFNENLPENTYILKNLSLEKILFDRSLTGIQLQKESFKASKTFFTLLKDEIEKYTPEERMELVNLTGSLYYYLSGAHGKIFNEPLGQNFIGVRRYKIPGLYDKNNKQSFKADIMYKSFESPGKICFCGETIATGVSLIKSLETFLPWAKENGLEKLFVFSICGSKEGIIKVNKICQEYDIKTIFVLGLALFGLGDDGTALTWNPKNYDLPITLPEYIQEGKNRFIEGECAIGDWGLRFKNPKRYLEEWEEERSMLKK